MKRFIVAVMMVLMTTGVAMAADIEATLDITFNPQAGDPIRSADLRQTWAEIEAWANASADSTLIWSALAAASINSTHLAPGAVTSNAIDSGAINADTMIAFNAISTSKFISTTDTRSNWMQSISGFYWGNGADSRLIHNTFYVGPNDSDSSGEKIGFTITMIEVYVDTNLASISSPVWTTDILMDTMVYTSRPSNLDIYTPSSTSLFRGYGDGTGGVLPLFVNSNDSSGFYVNNSWGWAGTYSLNSPNERYMWKAWGY